MIFNSIFISEDIILLLEKLKDIEYKAYKKHESQAVPPHLTPCERELWKFQRAEDCQHMREKWDAQWNPGEHTDHIENNIKNWVKNCRNLVIKNCGGSYDT